MRVQFLNSQDIYCRGLIVIFLFLPFLLGTGRESASAAEVFTIHPQKTVADWILDEESGRIFASLHEEAAVVEYRVDSGAEARRFKVGAKPGEMLIKGYRLIVGTASGPSLFAIDLRRNKVQGEVKLAGKGPYGLFCSRAKNPYVYAICNTGTAWWDGEVFQVDIEKLTVRNRVKVQNNWRQSHPKNVVMSMDGKWVLVNARGASSPSRADLMEVDETECTFADVHGYHESFGQFTAGPNGRFWMLGQKLYSLDIQKMLREFSGSPVAIHPTLDLVVGLEGVGSRSRSRSRSGPDGSRPLLNFQRFSTGESLTTVILPVATSISPSTRPSSDREAERDDPTLQFDVKNGRVFCSLDDRGYVVDVKSLGISPGTLLLLKLPGKVSTEIEKRLEIPLELSNPGLMKEIRFELGAAPKGCTINREKISWRPGPGDVGPHRIEVTARSGNSSDRAEIQIDVTRPCIDLGAVAEKMCVSPSGDSVAILAREITDQRRPGDQTASILMVVDIEKRRISARGRVREGVRAFFLEERYLYFAPREGAVFFRFTIPGFTDKKRVFLNQQVAGFAALPGGKLAVFTGRGHSPFDSPYELFDSKTLKRHPDQEAKEFRIRGLAMMPHSQRTMDGSFIPVVGKGLLLMEGWVIDATDGTLQLLWGNLPFPSIVSMTTSFNIPPPMLWSRQISGNSLNRAGGERITSWNSACSILLESSPAVVSLLYQTSSTPGSQLQRQKMSLEFRDLIEGQPREPLGLFDGFLEQRGQRPSTDFSRSLLAAAGKNILACVGSSLFVTPLPKEIIEKIPEPVHFHFRQDPVVVTTGAPVKITFTASGGTGSLTYGLLHEIRGVEIDSSTGVVRVDVPGIWKRFLEGIVEGTSPTPFSTRAAVPLPGQLEQYGSLFTAITGKPLKSDLFPMAVPLRLVVSDAEKMEDRLAATLLVLVPRREIEAMVKDRQVEIARLREEQQKKRKASPSTPKKSRGDTGVEERIAELESRLRRMEAALDTVLRRLKELEEGRGGEEKK